MTEISRATHLSDVRFHASANQARLIRSEIVFSNSNKRAEKVKSAIEESCPHNASDPVSVV